MNDKTAAATLEALLKATGLADGSTARALTDEGVVQVNGSVQARRGRELRVDDEVGLGGRHVRVVAASAASATLRAVDYPRYDPASPVTPLEPSELDGLDRLLAMRPTDGAMSLDGADGYLSALVLGPPTLLATLETAQWLPAIWGGDSPEGDDAAAPFASKRQRKDIVVLLLRHLRHLAQQFAEAPNDWEPIFSIAEQGALEVVDARDWCAGFLQAVDLMPGAWQLDWNDDVWRPLLALGGGLDGDGAVPEDLTEVDRLSRAVPDAALQLLPPR